MAIIVPVEVTGRQNLRGLNRDFDKLEAKGKQTGQTLKSSFAGAAKQIGIFAGVAGIGLAITKMTQLITKTIDFQDRIGKLSIRLGESTEFLSEMAFAADLSGVSFEALATGIQRANRRIGEAAAGTGEAKKALEELGLLTDIQNGRFKTFEEILPVLADRLNDLASDQDRLRLAFKLFDTEGVGFLQFLASGSEGIEKMREQARKLGLTLSQDMVDAASAAQDAITVLKASATGLLNVLSVKVFPVIARDMAALTALMQGEFREFNRIAGMDAQDFVKEIKTTIEKEAIPKIKDIKTTVDEITASWTALDTQMSILPTRLEPIRGKTFEIGEQLLRANDALEVGIEKFGTIEQITLRWSKSIEKVVIDMSHMEPQTKENIEGMRLLRDLAADFAGEMARAAFEGKRFSDVLASIVSRGISFGFSLIPGFGALSGRQFGGPVGRGQPVVVGESGPEIFMPNQSGNVIPNNQVTNNLTFNVHTQQFDEFVFRKRMLPIINKVVEKGSRLKASEVL